MKFSLSIASATLISILFLSAGLSEEKPKPSTLASSEIADGWLMLFDGETTFGWTIEGTAEVKDGMLILGRGKKTVAHPTTNFGGAFQYELELQGSARVESPKSLTVLQQVGEGFGKLTYSQSENSVSSSVGGVNSAVQSGVLSTRKELVAAPLLIETDGNNEVKIRSLKLKPLDSEALFNGKDLTGWKLYKGDPKRMATKFEVTPSGELNAKDGPGDLQTEKLFDNFVLQLDCKTNGKWLNSGIFFRCIADQYQNGYEAQIHNGFAIDRTKPVDFGTGAIYRRVPARKVVANDNEWFSMTLAADGPHFATWVNGYQTVDWTDTRKAAENPRNGLRTAKGHLSIQGHDKTTDILFRNMRISAIGKAK